MANDADIVNDDGNIVIRPADGCSVIVNGDLYVDGVKVATEEDMSRLEALEGRATKLLARVESCSCNASSPPTSVAENVIFPNCSSTPRVNSSGIYQVNGTDGVVFEAFCTHSYGAGGWNLVAVSSDDNVNTWTWNSRHLWDTDHATFGNVTERDSDFKSPAFHTKQFKDVLFVHFPSFIWAEYDSVSDGAQSFGQFIESFGGSVCYATSSHSGFPLSAGNLTKSGKLCNTRLYINAKDQDGKNTCRDSTGDHTYGPNWNSWNNAQCSFDEPTFASLGPDNDNGKQAIERRSFGYGGPKGLNTGVAGQRQIYMHVYIR